MNILLVDDEPSLRETLSETLRGCGYDVETAPNGAEALLKFPAGDFSLVITDMRMPKSGGIDLLRGIKKISPATPVIVITAYGTVNAAVEAMKEGAADFIMKPFPPDHIVMSVSNAVKRSAQEVKQDAPVPMGQPGVTQDRIIISQDRRMVAVQVMLKNVAKSKSSVLIQGESGTGKELFARFLYWHSDRRKKPFVAVNCAAIPEHLLESEMFGYEKGAFTGATQRKLGKFELANKGTLLLDEIGDMDLHLQAKLLRAIQEEIDRVGGHDPIPVDVRIIATTNVNLQRSIEEKKFRMDLYYRLNVVPVKIPPLRERGGDIDLLTDFFLTKYSIRNNRSKPKVSAEVMQMLRASSWPGNVRELENVIERAVLLCQGTEIVPENLCFDEPVSPVPANEGNGGKAEFPALSGMTLRDMEKNLIFETLQTVNGNKTRASELLGVSVRTVRNKLNEYQLEQVS